VAETPASVLLAEGVLAKFLRYVRVDTTADPAAAGVPSSPGQWELAHQLAAEAKAMGLHDVQVDEHGIVTATLPPSPGVRAPTVGWLAHMDTSPAVSGRGVRPIVHAAYDGRPIALPAGPVLDPATEPLLREVVGHDLVTSDGRTLLGADDKAGVAEIMAALAHLLSHPEIPRPRVRVAFTTDEETGRGIEFFDVAAFGADVAYTLDGGPLGELAAENFHAVNYRVTIRGRSAHTGTARGQMVNAVDLAATLVRSAPAAARPETTSGREGFVHFDAIRGHVEEVELVVLLRDFEREGLEAREAWLRHACAALEAGVPGAVVSLERTGGYRNMREVLERRPEVVSRAEEAMRRAGVVPRHTAIRGGTDGARLSERGLPTPNLFTGGVGFHSRTEWVSVPWMERAVATLVELARLWATEAADAR
jgi:tripeptide aminopeptidase